jgi:hypothetical protein
MITGEHTLHRRILHERPALQPVRRHSTTGMGKGELIVSDAGTSAGPRISSSG